LAATAVVVLGATSCGGDDGDTSSDGDASSCGSREIVVQTGTAAPPTLPAGDDELTAAVADTFCATFVVKLSNGTTRTASPVITSRTDARCIATSLLRSLGADRVRQLGFGRYAWSLLGFGLSNHASIQRAEAETNVAIFERCSKSWKLLMIKSITEGTDKISDASARCTSSRLSDRDARTIFAGELDRAYDEGPGADPFGDAVEPLIKAMEKCLQPDELDRLDWN